MSMRVPIQQQALRMPEGTAAQFIPHGIQQVHQKNVRIQDSAQILAGSIQRESGADGE